MVVTSPPRERPNKLVIVAVLALLLGLQPVTTDLYLPALPALTAELGGSMAGAQLTLSALILSFGVAQLAMGPLADRFGRRPVLLAGLALYVLASVGGTLAGHLSALVAWRAVQGVGLACAVVCARAMVRDLYQPHEGARVMSLALTGLGLLALSSPMAGGLIATWAGWRVAIAATGVFAAATLAVIGWRMPETVPERNRHALRPGPLLATWRRIVGHPTFRAWALLVACSYGGLYVYLAGSAFVYIEVLGLSRGAFGVVLALNSLAYVTGTFWCRRLLVRHGLAGAARRGAVCTAAGGVALAALALAGVHSAWAIALPQAVFAVGHGVNQPCGQAAVTGPFPANAGAAAALAGFVLAVVAFALGAWLGVSMDGTVYPLTLTIAVFALLTAAVGLTLVQRHGEQVAAAPAR